MISDGFPGVILFFLTALFEIMLILIYFLFIEISGG